MFTFVGLHNEGKQCGSTRHAVQQCRDPANDALDVHVLEKVLPHERVVRLGVVAWNPHVFVHCKVFIKDLVLGSSTHTPQATWYVLLNVTTLANESSPAWNKALNNETGRASARITLNTALPCEVPRASCT